MRTPSNLDAMRRKKEAGQAIVVMALALVVLLGFMGFGIDMGMLRYEKRLQQTAADAAAIAGANDLAWEGSASVGTAAKNASAQNGFTDGSGNVTVTVNNPPLSGPHQAGTANADDYVEVVISAVHATYFERVVGINQATVVARAVATDYSGASGNGSNCLVTLGDPANEIGVDVQGSVTLNATQCGIVDNGNFDPTGNGMTVNSCNFSVSGANGGNGTGNVTCNGSSYTPSYNMPTQQDPMSNLDSQTPCDLGYNCNASSSPASPNTAGCTGGATICCPGGATVCSFQSVKIGSGTTTFAPGIYIVDGGGSQNNPGFTCQGSPNIDGQGVMFFFTNAATIQCNGDGTINLQAPNAQNCPSCPSAWNGVLMWQDANDTSTGKLSLNGNSCTGGPQTLGPELGGNSGGNGTSDGFDGVLYFPNDQLWFYGNSHGSVNTVDIAASISDSMCMTGNADFNFVGTTGVLGPGTGPLSTLTSAVLVE